MTAGCHSRDNFGHVFSRAAVPAWTRCRLVTQPHHSALDVTGCRTEVIVRRTPVSRTPRAHRRLAIAAVVLAVLSATGCGSEGTDSDVSGGDPSDAYRVIASMHDADGDDLEPFRLADALPNREVVVGTDTDEKIQNSFSDLVVTGQITKVAPDEGIFYPTASSTATGDKEAGAKGVGFDNPDAQERIALVTMQVDWSAGDQVGSTVQFRIGVPVGTDANKFLAGVRGIDHAVVLLEQFDGGRYEGDYYPIMDFAGLGSVDDDGNLAFQGLGEGESAFLAGVTTLDQLEAEASKPELTVQY
jgi:hypothetical protein